MLRRKETKQSRLNSGISFLKERGHKNERIKGEIIEFSLNNKVITNLKYFILVGIFVYLHKIKVIFVIKSANIFLFLFKVSQLCTSF